MLGVDLANYSATPTPDQLNQWWDAGVRFVVVGCQKDQAAHSHLQALTADGRFDLAAYQYYYWDGSEIARTERALQVMNRFGINRLWIDVEEPRDANTSQNQTRVAVANALATARQGGVNTGIYTGGWCWPDIIGNYVGFNNEPLWHAAYPADGQPPAFDTFKPYGGWTRPLIWQYKGSTTLAGVNVDLNAMEDAPVPPAAVTIDGIGVVLDDGTDLGNVLPPLPEGRTVAGVGAHLTDGTIEGLWPK